MYKRQRGGCVRACVHACLCVCVSAWVRARARACVCVCVCVCEHLLSAFLSRWALSVSQWQQAILNKWLQLYTVHDEYSLKWLHLQRCLVGDMTGVTWKCCCLSACSVYAQQPCITFTVSLYSKQHMQGACVFGCNLPPALLAEWPGSFTCYCSKLSNTGMEQIAK